MDRMYLHEIEPRARRQIAALRLRCGAPSPARAVGVWGSAERLAGRVRVRQPRHPNAPPSLTASAGREGGFELLRIINHAAGGATLCAAGPSCEAQMA